jgi:hypothetical protein
MTADDNLESFRAAYRADFGRDITLAEAREMSHNLLTLLEQLAKPLPPERQSS